MIERKESISMKKSIAMLSALLMGLSYCPPGTVTMAMEDLKLSLEDENSFADESLSNDDGRLSAEQMLPEKDESLSADESLYKKEENLSAGQTLSEKEENPSVDRELLDNESSFEERLWKKIADKAGEKKEQNMDTESEKHQKAERREHKTADTQAPGLNNLQIPQKLDIVIDPWEMDGRGQVYSDVYVIRNTGDTSGILTLSNLACRPREESRVVIKSDRDGLHDSNDKYIYLEMLFGNRDRIIFSSEKSQYQTELKPGEELSICFSGEVNENAFAKWMDQDVAISVVYSWKVEDTLDGLNLEESEEKQMNISEDDGLNGQERQERTNVEEEQADRQQTDKNMEKLTDTLQIDMSTEQEQKEEPEEEKQESNLPEETVKNSYTLEDSVDQESVIEEETDDINSDTQQDDSINRNIENEKMPEADYNTDADQTDRVPEITIENLQTDEGIASSDEKEKEEVKTIGLQESKRADIEIDSWKMDEKGKMVSPQYLLCNAGDTTGTWILSDFICKPQESSGVRVITDKKGLYDSDDKVVYMELMFENDEKVVLSQESSMYKVKLEPGEKLAVRFIGEINGNLFESWEEGDIVVTAVYSWNRD